MNPSSLVTLALIVGSLAGFGALLVRARRRQEEAATATLAAATQRGAHIPLSLHPEIDPDICIGSMSCLQACPEGDILGMVDNAAKLIEPTHCIGHGKCAAECPVQAIRLVFGTSERGVDLPEVDGYFESSRLGVHIVGELGGMGLIRNAVTQGSQVAERLATVLDRTSVPNVVDVAIVGSGPAGLATALGCRVAGLSYRLLEQDTVGGTVAHYPRHKVVMTEPVDLPGVGRLNKKVISKEELLAVWKKAIQKAQLVVEEGVQVTGIDGADGAFELVTPKGLVRARKVVLAIGRRGTPRKLGIPGEGLPKVSYRLADPEQYLGSRVLVVGGGDSALEAAIQLCNETDAEVALAHRGDDFTKCRDANRKQVRELEGSGRLTVFLRCQPVEIRGDRVVLKVAEKPIALLNDYVIVCAGGELPLGFLHQNGISLRKYQGEALGDAKRPDTRLPAPRARGVKELEEERRTRRFALILTAIGALVVLGLALKGLDYYLLERAERARDPLHKVLRPAGPWGHGVGIVATLFMLSNFLYAARKRWGFMKGVAPIRRWLTFHQFVGFMSPLTIAFHAAFQSNNHLATATSASLLIVVGTGIVGRFIYGLVPTRDGRAIEHKDVVGRFERLKARLEPHLVHLDDPEATQAVLRLATAPSESGTLPTLFARLPLEALQTRWSLRRLKPLFDTRAEYRVFRADFLRLVRVRNQVTFYKGLKRFMSTWRVLHAVLAIFLVVMIAAHIGISLFLGYGLGKR